MKKAVILLLFGMLVHAQMTYRSLVDNASKVSDTKDPAKLTEALNLYDGAFKNFPAEVDAESLYDAATIAMRLKKKEAALKYLEKFIKIPSDPEGTPTWKCIIGPSASEDFKDLAEDERWKAVVKNAQLSKQRLLSENRLKEEEFFRKGVALPYDANKSFVDLYNSLRNSGGYLPKQDRNYSISLKISDKATTAYFVHLPDHYDPGKRYPVLIFLHGAVRHTSLSDYETPEDNLGNWNRFYTKYADRNGVILVFPKASKEYNWMLGNEGFFMVPEIVRQLKTALNIDDDKVFLTGHSNGATGSFSYLVKDPTLFAGFYGFNTQPKVYTGGTFVENILNRSFMNFSTDLDYYFPPGANDDLDRLMKSLRADYQDHRFTGFTHSFPQYDKSEPAYRLLFADLSTRTRKPFPKNITWEFDDDRYSSVDWLASATLDTLRPRAAWHTNENFRITKVLQADKNDSLREVKVDKNAFDFPRKSGKIIAEYADNRFDIKTSDVSALRLYLSPEMVDLRKKVLVFVNGRKMFDGIVVPDKDFMIRNFDRNHDRSQVWVNEISVKAD